MSSRDETEEGGPGRFTFESIGVARTPHQERVDAPRQPMAAEGVVGRIELAPGRGFEDAAADLAAWEYIWVIFVFDRNLGATFRPKVLPPRSDVKRGVLATRSPHRPNAIGLSVLRVLSVEGLTVHVADVDLLDGTPILDIKPYLAWTDAIPRAGGGWLEEAPAPARSVGERPVDPRRRWAVSHDDRADEQLRFLAERGVDIRQRIDESLALGPQPHAYRRIRKEADGGYRLAIKDWRVRFRVVDGAIEVLSLSTGYRPKQLHGGDDPALDLHRAFVARFG